METCQSGRSLWWEVRLAYMYRIILNVLALLLGIWECGQIAPSDFAYCFLLVGWILGMVLANVVWDLVARKHK